MRIELQPAYLLHSRPYRDSSALVDLLTLDHGLIRAVARGVRGRRRSTALQQHQLLLVSLSGRGELLTLTHTEQAAAGFFLTGHRLFSALYLNEILERLLQPADSHPAVFRLYQQTLLRLHEEYPLEPLLRSFEWSLLQELGYEIDFSALEPGHCYRFDPLNGFEPVASLSDRRDFAGQALLSLKKVLTGDPLLMTLEQQSDAKRLMRQALGPLLGNKPLMSRHLFMAGTE
ncbi:DNA repair protein RecO [Pseudohongiella spirulinae]|uniref:DNA repair protein RecO n=1 Tax=Pseudohongiella spirulinae TaxID=1249552 RepID=A0A0S2KD52_9GAMM|nr:DNA repair protein RecO [Pseudohongiella spirulinae]ALO46246.1 DNA repair protein RecO [Pseudohongiella spirulinae]